MMSWELIRRFWYLPLLAVLAIGLMSTRSRLADVKDDLAKAKAFGTLVVDTTREAAGNPKLPSEQVPAQIAAMGRSVGALRIGLDRCNAAALAAAEADAAAQRLAAERLRQAETRDAGRQALIDRLRASAAKPRPAGQCEASDTVKEIWR